MEGQENKYNNARIRIHFPERTKEEQEEMVKKATETFLKKAIQRKKVEK